MFLIHTVSFTLYTSVSIIYYTITSITKQIYNTPFIFYLINSGPPILLDVLLSHKAF